MKKYSSFAYIFSLSILGCILIVLYFSLSGENLQVQPTNKIDTELKRFDNQIIEDENSSIESMNINEPSIDKKSTYEESPKTENPDLYAQYHYDIRTQFDDLGPTYQLNHKVTELLKARNISSTLALSKATSENKLNWIERGPGNVGGRTRGLLIDPRDPLHNTWYAGSVGGGVWKTEDFGNTWKNMTANLLNLATSTLAMSIANPDVIYAGTGEGFFNIDQVEGTGIWKTTDAGLTWIQLESTATEVKFQTVTRIIVDPFDENILLVSTVPGIRSLPGVEGKSYILRSIDGGVTWTTVYESLRTTGTSRKGSIQQIIYNPHNFNVQYAAINRVGVIKSVDGGKTWFNSSNGIRDVHDLRRFEMAIAPSDTSRLYISAERDPYIFFTNNSGAEWIAVEEKAGINTRWQGGQGWYDNTIAVDPYDKNNIFVGRINLWKINLTQETTSDTGIISVDYENTSSFLNINTSNFKGVRSGLGTNGKIKISVEEHSNVEIRFGPGKSQMAHRFAPELPSRRVLYRDYSKVPFEAWDIDNEKQLTVSYWDVNEDSIWNLNSNTFISDDFLYVHTLPYDAVSPDPEIVFHDTTLYNSGTKYKQMYWIVLVASKEGVTGPDNLPESEIKIIWGETQKRIMEINNITDGYNEFGGDDKGVHVDHHNIVIVPVDESDDYIIFDANDGGVSASIDKGKSFTQKVNGYVTSQFYGVDKKNGSNEYIGGTQDNSTWRSPPGEDAAISSNWTEQFGGDGFETIWHYTDPDKLLGSAQFNTIFRSTDGGNSWFPATNGMEIVVDGFGDIPPFFTKLAKSKQDPDLVFAVGAIGIWRSDNFASKWNLIPFPISWGGSSSTTEVKISLSDPQIIWTGNRMKDDKKLYVSQDGGLSFNETSNYSEVVLNRISGLETHPVDRNIAYALFSYANAPKILRTTDLGQTWEDISGFRTGSVSVNGFPDVAVYSLLVMPYDTNIIWAGTEIGIFESRDNGDSWSYADNGFPAAPVFEMLIVNDQVVVGTHGRGIWSVSLPELTNFEAPVVTLSPRLNAVGMSTLGNIIMDASLRSDYDSTQVLVGGLSIFSFQKTTPIDTLLNIPITNSSIDSLEISLISFKNEATYQSFTETITVFQVASPQITYSNNFDSDTDDFFGEGFEIATPQDFSDPAIHSNHPYANKIDISYVLKTPIEISSDNPLLQYDDIALIEPGANGAQFGDSDFFDFVVVEGSRDGVTWKPLADGYDSDFVLKWKDAYSSGNTSSSLYKTHVVNLLDTFSVGDVIFIRFRLVSDPLKTGWGWAIDNISIQDVVTNVESEQSIPITFRLDQNYPNPFNPTTTIDFSLPVSEHVSLKIFNILGQQIKTLVSETMQSGFHKIVWNGTNDTGRSVSPGLYFYFIRMGEFNEVKKMMLIK